MLTVKIIFKDGSFDLKDVWDLDEICLDNVLELKVIRDERKKVA
jgi:hypothetical protein